VRRLLSVHPSLTITITITSLPLTTITIPDPLDVVRIGSVRGASTSTIVGDKLGVTAAKYSFELKETRVFLYQVNWHSSCVIAVC
jgi:hypothetical protein